MRKQQPEVDYIGFLIERHGLVIGQTDRCLTKEEAIARVKKAKPFRPDLIPVRAEVYQIDEWGDVIQPRLWSERR